MHCYIQAAKRCLNDEIEESSLLKTSQADVNIDVNEKKFYKKKRKGPVQSKKIHYDGITFASGLRTLYVYGFKKAKITLFTKDKRLS